MTYYGTCGSTAYAVASFEAAPTATAAQTVAFQDHGVWPEFFTRNGDASWHLVGSADGPPGPRDCTDFTQAPSTLREIWHNCIQATPQSAPTVSPAASCGPADAQFVQVLSVTLGSDGSATSTAHPLTLVCGGPDDRHFDIGSATETIHILANADIMVLAGNSGSEMAITLKQLAATTPIAPAFFPGQRQLHCGHGPDAAIRSVTTIDRKAGVSDVDAEFTAFVHANGTRLSMAAKLLVGDHHAAEDLLQAALIKTYLAWRRVDEPYAFTRQVMARLSIDRWRRRRWREVTTDALPELAASSDHADDAVRRDDVQHALATLTRRERAVIVLRYWDDRTEQQIAEILGIAPGTVKSTAARALVRLRAGGGMLRLDDGAADHV